MSRIFVFSIFLLASFSSWAQSLSTSYLTLSERPTIPPAKLNKVSLYGWDVSGVTKVFAILSDGSIVDLSGGGGGGSATNAITLFNNTTNQHQKILIGTAGTDVALVVSGFGGINTNTINIPTASATVRGVISAADYINIIFASEIDTVAELNAILSDGDVATIDGTETLANKTLTTPTIGSFVNAGHNHQNAAGGGALSAAAITTGTLADAVIPSSITRDTEWDTEAEVQTAWGGVNIILATEIDTSAELAAIMGDETGSGLLVFGTSPTITTPTISGAIAFPDGVRQTFNPNGTTPGLNFGAQAGDPSTPTDGDVWYNSTTGKFRKRENGATSDLDTTGGGSFGETSLAGLVNNQTLWDGSQASRSLTLSLSGATDPVFTFANALVGLQVGLFMDNLGVTNLATFRGPVAYTNVTISGTDIDWNLSSARFKQITADTTFTFSNLADDRHVYVEIAQDSAGAHATTWPTATWIGHTNQTGTVTANTNGSTVTIYHFWRRSGTVYAEMSTPPSTFMVEFENTQGASFINDTAFASSWNGITSAAPTKNALYDILHIGDADDDGKIDVLDLAAAGFPAINSSGALVASRTHTGTALDITVANGDGASGNPTYSLDRTATLAGNPAMSANGVVFGTTGFIFEGATANSSELLLKAADPGADITVTIPATDGTLALLENNLGSFATTSSAQLAGVVSDESGSGVFVMSTSPTITTPTFSGAITFPDGVRQTFNPDATNPGLNVGAQAGDPSTPSNGDIWYNSTTGKFRKRENGSTTDMDTVGAGSFGETSLAGLVNNQTLWDSSQSTRTLTFGLSGATDPSFVFANNSITMNGNMTFDSALFHAAITLEDGLSLADDISITFNPGATFAGLNVGAVASAPSTLSNGDIWYDSTGNKFKKRENGVTANLDDTDDTAFASSWNGLTLQAPSKNALYDWAHIFDTDDDGKVNVVDLGAGIPKTDSSGVLSVATAGTDYTSPSSTETFSNKTFDAANTGNVLKFKSYIYIKSFDLINGLTVPNTNDLTAATFMKPVFSNSADEAANYFEVYLQVPDDIDTSVEPRAKLTFRLNGADTGTQRYVLSMANPAASGAFAGTVGTAINMDFAGDASGANNDVEQVGYTTLTGWGAALTAGRHWVLRLARDGNATQDGSTVDSMFSVLTIEYAVSQ